MLLEVSPSDPERVKYRGRTYFTPEAPVQTLHRIDAEVAE
jgi:hypothetical protein